MAPRPKQVPTVEPVESAAAPQQSPIGCLARLAWTFVGNGALFFLAVSILNSPPTLSWRDAAYWAVAVALVAIRYVDIDRLGGTTADGQPATMSHWRRYTVILIAASTILWAGAHLVSFLLAA